MTDPFVLMETIERRLYSAAVDKLGDEVREIILICWAHDSVLRDWSHRRCHALGCLGCGRVSRDYPRLEGRTYEKNRTNMQAARIGAPVGWNQTQRLEIDLV